ncbi:hypothetical protein PFICI_03083 [Pestalotiopsis fici W106-1]|uniref:Fork-head domain-containing protein n=1 Tax=Pestalotiopsis fici (strain W106-1 / CGMCC3.15140) TaxID=1229662 RepID=W3XG33_PESFW|nr:uncharacterized protein PFICI_03083 [Pestalotiopsis fici W106-1]ETS85058.1 hypothetical protein PFICI_03083 [Pestalotiopsis fici W106-1]
MQLTFCDGLPVDHASPDATSNDPEQICTTQSPKITRDYPNPDTGFPPSPSLDIAETAQLPSKQSLHFPPSAITTAPQTHTPLVIHPSSSPYQGMPMWPTPPPTSDDEFDEYTYRSSPTSASFGLHATAALSPPSLVHSPRSWSPAGSQQFPYQEAAWKTPDFTPPYGLHMGTQLQMEDAFNQPLVASPFADDSYLSRTMEPEPMTPSVPSMTPDPADSAMSDHSLSPGPNDDLDNSYTHNDEGTPPPGSNGQEEDADLDADEANRPDEPYAQLIFRAFMSREDHAMTLQEIYQWFRENTDRAVPEHKGWQNSIRHNLSMNGAFVKRDRRETPDGPVTDAGTPRRSTEWILQDWAVRDGVQSTTRYRPRNNPGRRSTGAHRSNRGHHVSARATSGRRGGITASRTRLAASRRTALRGYGGGVFASRIPRNDFQRQQNFYGRAPSMDFGQAARSDPATPPEVPAGELLFTNTMQGPPPMGSVTSHGYFFGHGEPQHQQIHSPIPHSHTGVNPYRLEDVTGVYEAPTIQNAGVQVEASHMGQLSASFGNLFTEDMGESTQGSAMGVGNMNYGWGDGSQFQS